MAFSSISNSEIAIDKPVDQPLMQQIKDNFDYFNGTIGSFNTVDVLNGSFEIDADADTIPDTWTRNLYAGGSAAIITSPTGGHGSFSYQFTQPAGASQGGGDLTSDYIPIYRNQAIPLGFQCGTSNGTVIAKVVIKCYDAAKAAAGADQTIFTSSGTESLDKMRIAWFIPNTGTKYIRIKLVGGEVGPNTSATVQFDNVTLRPHLRRLEVNSATMAEQNTVSASYVTVGAGMAIGLNQKIYNSLLVIMFIAEMKSSTTTNDMNMRFIINATATSSNEATMRGQQYITAPFIIRWDPAGADAFAINMQLKSVSGTAYGQKLFGPIAIFMEDKNG
jgi:hypothetical protein